MADNESFDRAMDERPGKRKRSSILRMPDKKRESITRTVSFNDRCTYKELHHDGTSDITNLFLRDDMDLTLMDVIETTPCPTPNATNTSNMDISADDNPEEEEEDEASTSQTDMSISMTQSNFTSSQPDNGGNQPDISSAQTDISVTMAHDTTLTETTKNITTITSRADSSAISTQSSTVSQFEPESIISDISPAEPDISSISSIDSYTFYGAFHESNNISMESNASLGDTLINNIEALDDYIKKVDHDQDLSRQKLDEEIEDLFKFYRHHVNSKNKYEFAIAIFGLRHSLWLILKLRPDTYPHEKIDVKFVVNKKDRHLYPFPEYMEALRQFSKEGNYGYLTRLVINAQKFRRFLRTKSYKKSANLKS